MLTLGVATMMLACNQSPKENQGAQQTTDTVEAKQETVQATKAFNIEDIPYASSTVGDFPFFTLPKGLEEQNKPLQKKFDVCFFPINGIMTPFEGRLYKANVTASAGEEFSQRYFEKSLTDYLTSIGAVQVYDAEISTEEYERYHKLDPNKGDEGDIGYAGDLIKFFVIRTKDKGNIYVQFTANNASGKLNILQEEAFQQTISKVTAAEIEKDLTEKGKSILYINFDVDKASISPEGKTVVQEIAAALKKNGGMKIAIEGHTDNSGDAAYNKKLSEDRAQSVLKALVSSGIDKSSLVANGFGAEQPLVANDSEANKAKNRRVELVKVN